MRRPVWLLNRTVLATHRRQLAEHGGATGVDFPQLALALGWPKTVLALADGKTTMFELAAAYSEALLRLRPFASGNERMAYLLGKLFLRLNGIEVPATTVEQLAMFGALRAGAIDRPRYSSWLLMRRFVAGGGTVIGVTRDRSGRVLKVGVLRRGSRRAAAGRVTQPLPAQVEPMLQD